MIYSGSLHDFYLPDVFYSLIFALWKPKKSLDFHSEPRSFNH